MLDNASADTVRHQQDQKVQAGDTRYARMLLEGTGIDKERMPAEGEARMSAALDEPEEAETVQPHTGDTAQCGQHTVLRGAQPLVAAPAHQQAPEVQAEKTK